MVSTYQNWYCTEERKTNIYNTHLSLEYRLCALTTIGHTSTLNHHLRCQRHIHTYFFPFASTCDTYTDFELANKSSAQGTEGL